jgi:UDP-N-acetylglucosamine--N-acetylmuramyl-(pentapeptide) pyrophosphoryl-undecaprenol N-acetylglucosamine transferase
MKILFTGGGTGGHVVPLLAVAREIRKIYQGQDHLRFFYMGPKDDFGKALLSQEDIIVKNVLAGKFRRYPGFESYFQNFIGFVFLIPLGIIQSFFRLLFLYPDIVFSKGGFGSVPVVIAARMLFIPVVIHESDIVPGFANKFVSKAARKILVSFPGTKYFAYNKMKVTGNAIRKELLAGTKEEAREFFKLGKEKPIILVMGGSQGAERINDKILEGLPALLQEFEVIHQSGERNFYRVRNESRITIEKYKTLESSYHLFAFLKEPELKYALAGADLIVSRAGSNTIFEIAAVSKPSILVPLPEAAQNHQVENAYAYAATGACVVMEENNFSSRFFLEKLRFLFANPQELEKMSRAAREFARPEAAKMIAQEILSTVSK